MKQSIYILGLITAILFSSQLVVGQNAALGDGVLPPSSAGAFGKYADIPISHYTGIPAINIPLCAPQEGPLSIPISLSYHASGIRVAELSSSVGVGWYLNSGGAITRTVMGLPDDEVAKKGYYYNGDELNSFIHSDEVAAGDRDGEPDIFTFNFMGKAGKFFIDKHQNVQFIPMSDVVVEVEEYGFDFISFKITDTDGTIYYFNEREFLRDEDEMTEYPVTWYLSKVETHDQKHAITIHYKDNIYKYKALASCSHGVNSSGSAIFRDCQGEVYDTWRNYQQFKIAGKVIDYIETTTDRVDFFYEDREDVDSYFYQRPTGSFDGEEEITEDITYYGQKLDRLEMTSGTFCYEYDLEHTYFEDTSDKSGTPESKRLKLNSVQKISCSGLEQENPTEFTYNGNYLPNRLSKAIDHWGYYNGKTSNNTKFSLVPTGSHVDGRFYGDAIRNPSSVIDQSIGVLTDIEFPTGGTHHFEFETNSTERLVIQAKTYLISNLTACPTIGSDCCGNHNDSRTITLTEEQIAYGKMEIRGQLGSLGGVDLYEVCGSFDAEIYFSIKNTLDNSYAVNKNFSINGNNGETKTLIFYFRNLGIVAGVPYTFNVNTNSGKGTMNVYYFKQNQFDNEPIGGLRIQELKIHDGLHSDRDIIKTYEYKNSFGKSSGIVFNQPKYGWDNSCDANYTFISSPVLSLTSFEGYHIGYDRVTEFYNGHGKIEYAFRVEDPFLFDSEYTEEFESYPATPSQPRVFSGYLQYQKSYREGSAIPYAISTVQRNDDTYFEFGNSIPSRFAVRSDGCGTSTYTLSTSIYRPKMITNTMDGVSTSTSIEYSSQNLNPVETITQYDDNTSIRVHTWYTDGHIGEVGEEFLARNIIQPYWTQSFVTSEDNPSEAFIDGSKTTYRFFNSIGKPNDVRAGGQPYPWAKKKYEVTWINGVKEEGWRDLEYYTDYNMDYGYVFKKHRNGWTSESFLYDTKKRLEEKKFNSFTTSYTYANGSLMVATGTEVDGQSSTTTYDDLMRIKTHKDNCTKTLMTYDYHFKDPNDNEDRNYVYTKTDYLEVSGSDLDILENYQYLDGIGRTIQTVAKKQGPLSTDDIALQTDYNKWGQISRQYEPIKRPNNLGAYVDDIAVTDPHSIIEYYNEPTARKYRSKSAGWAYYTTYLYDHNTSAGDGTITDPIDATDFADADLMKSTVIDGNGNKSYAFTDKRGRTILKRRANATDGERTDTYYRYDDKNRLLVNYPPGSSDATPELIYTYEYNRRDQIIEKKIPGKAKMEYRYSIKDLLNYSRDGYLKSLNKWYAFQYDSYGRDLKSGFYNFSGTPIDLDDDIVEATISEDLTENVYGTVAHEIDKLKTTRTKILDGSSNWIESTSVYDNCGRVTSSTGNNHLYTNLTAETISVTYDWADNVLTDTRTHKASAAAIDQQMILNTYTYDHAGRFDHSIFKLNSETERILSNLTYDHKNQVITNQVGSKNGGASYLQTMNYSYLQNGLPTGTNVSFASSDLFHERLYYLTEADNVDQVIQKNGNITAVESQVIGKNKRTYGFSYDHLDRMTYADYYGGTTASDNDFTVNGIQYDERGNLKNLWRLAKIDGVAAEQAIDILTYNYVNNANQISNVTDVAAAAYRSKGYNRKNTSNYTYDVNGNVKYDPSRGVTFTYNHLDLPVTADFGGGKTIEWLYDAGGGLLTKTVKQSGAPIDKRDYIGGIEYKDDVIDVVYHGEGRVVNTNSGATGTLNLSGTISTTKDYEAETINSTQIIQSPGNIDYQASASIMLNPGFEVKTGALFNGHIAGGAGGVSWEYQYTISDHLGNTRVVYADKDGNGSIDPSTEIIQSNDYYPFGLKMDDEADGIRDEEAYQYNGIEYVEDHGLNYNMATYRCLDPALGRWMSVDPKAESSMGLSPYNSMNNNPISNVDPNGDNPFLIGAAIGFVTNGISNVISGQNFFNGAFQAIVLGAIGGSFGSGIGTLTSEIGNGFARAGVQAAAHGLLGGVLSDAGGGKFGSGLLSGAIASGVGSGIGSIKGLEGAGLDWALWGGGGISGGVGSVIGGGNFFSGLRQGLITGGLNHAGNHAFGQPDPPPWDLNGDGHLSLSEANAWYRNGNGVGIAVDAQAVDLDFLNPEDWSVNEYLRVQTLTRSNTGRVYGNIDVTYIGNNQFTIGPDNYHFPHAPGSGAFRNFSNWVGKVYAGKGTMYRINFNGVNNVNYSRFVPNFSPGFKGF